MSQANTQENLNTITEIITGVLNPDNTQRNISMQKLDQLRKEPKILISSLFEIIIQSNNNQTKLISIILLSNILRIKDHELSNENWEKLGNDQREKIRKISFEFLKMEKDRKLRNKFCNLIQIVYENSYEINEDFPEVIEYITNIFSIEEIKNQEELDLVEISLELLSANFSILEHHFVPNIQFHLASINKFLGMNFLSLKTKCVRALSEIIAYCDNVEIFEPFVFKILETTLNALEGSKDNEIQVMFSY